MLQRLSELDTAAVAEHLLGQTGLDAQIRARIVEAAEGNPLFVEQLLSMMIDEGLIVFSDGAWRPAAAIDSVSVPPTIQALLAARLDHLQPDERAVIEPASVIGQIFVGDAVEHLVPDHVSPSVPLMLTTLTDKQLVQPDASRTVDEDAYRFHHILIRDTAYEGILKRARATFHEEFVRWADTVNREGATEYEEILGYHLEQAHRYLSELGPLDDHGRALGTDGSRRLASLRAGEPSPAETSRPRRVSSGGRSPFSRTRIRSGSSSFPTTVRRSSRWGVSRSRRPSSTRRSRGRASAGCRASGRTHPSSASSSGFARAIPRAGAPRQGRRSTRRSRSSSRRETTPGSRRHGVCSPGHTGPHAASGVRPRRRRGRSSMRASPATRDSRPARPPPMRPPRSSARRPSTEGIELSEGMVEVVSGDRQSEGILLALLGSHARDAR